MTLGRSGCPKIWKENKGFWPWPLSREGRVTPEKFSEQWLRDPETVYLESFSWRISSSAGIFFSSEDPFKSVLTATGSVWPDFLYEYHTTRALASSRPNAWFSFIGAKLTQPLHSQSELRNVTDMADRAFYCAKKCEKSKSTTFSYYEIQHPSW